MFQGDLVKSGVLSTAHHDVIHRKQLALALACPAPSCALPIHISPTSSTLNSRSFLQQKAATMTNLWLGTQDA